MPMPHILWAAGGIMFTTCPSVCACVRMCVPGRRYSLTNLPSTSIFLLFSQKWVVLYWTFTTHRLCWRQSDRQSALSRGPYIDKTSYHSSRRRSYYQLTAGYRIPSCLLSFGPKCHHKPGYTANVVMPTSLLHYAGVGRHGLGSGDCDSYPAFGLLRRRFRTPESK